MIPIIAFLCLCVHSSFAWKKSVINIPDNQDLPTARWFEITSVNMQSGCLLFYIGMEDETSIPASCIGDRCTEIADTCTHRALIDTLMTGFVVTAGEDVVVVDYYTQTPASFTYKIYNNILTTVAADCLEDAIIVSTQKRRFSAEATDLFDAKRSKLFVNSKLVSDPSVFSFHVSQNQKEEGIKITLLTAHSATKITACESMLYKKQADEFIYFEKPFIVDPLNANIILFFPEIFPSIDDQKLQMYFSLSQDGAVLAEQIVPQDDALYTIPLSRYLDMPYTLSCKLQRNINGLYSMLIHKEYVIDPEVICSMVFLPQDCFTYGPCTLDECKWSRSSNTPLEEPKQPEPLNKYKHNPVDILRKIAPCEGYNTSIEVPRLPRFEVDHTAFAVARVVGTHPLHSGLDWIIHIKANNGEDRWLQQAAAIDTAPDDYHFHIKAGVDYKVDWIVSHHLPDAVFEDLTDFVCLVDGPLIEAEPPVHIEFVDARLMECEELLVIFTVRSNIAVLPLPRTATGAYKIDGIGTGIETDIAGVYEYTYVLGPVSKPLLPYKKTTDALLVEFDFSGITKIYLSNIGDMLQKELLSPPSQFKVLTPSAVTVNIGLPETQPACAATLYDVGIDVINNTPFSHVITTPTEDILVLPDSRPISTVAKGFTTLPYGESYHEHVVSVAINPAVSGLINEVCKDYRIRVSSNIHIPMQVTAQMKIKEHMASVSSCQNERDFVFVFPPDLSRMVTFYTNEDPDLGTIKVDDRQVFSISAFRHVSIVLKAYISPTNNSVSTPTPCSVSIPTDHLLRNAVYSPPYTEVLAVIEDDPINDRLGSVSIKISYENNITLYSKTTTIEPGLVFKSSETGTVTYTYWNLPSGMYVLHAQNAHCKTTEMVFIASTRASEFKNLIDMRVTTHGSDAVLCPLSYFKEKNTWQYYYKLQVDKDKIKYMDVHNMRMEAYIWNVEEGEKKQIQPAQDGSYVYKIPTIGKYVSELVVIDDTRASTPVYASIISEEYHLKKSDFEEFSITTEVQTYPTCINSVDGSIKINFPSILMNKVEYFLRGCMALDESIDAACRLPKTIDHTKDSDRPHIILYDMQFTRELRMSFEFFGSCAFDYSLEMLPPKDTHPRLVELAYLESCALSNHRIVPMGRDFASSELYPIVKNNNLQFVWSTDGNEAMSDGASLYIDPMHPPVRVSLTLSYNRDKCVHDPVSKATVVIGKDIVLFTPPMIAISPIKDGESLGIFCPQEPDAMLVANFYPVGTASVFRDIKWSGEIDHSTSIIKTTPGKSILANIGPGKYTVEYTYLQCTVSSSFVVPAKYEYNVLSHLHTEPAKCDEDVSSLRIDMRHHDIEAGERDDNEELEISAIIVEMIPVPARKYLVDSVSGSMTMNGMPDGFQMQMQIRYPDDKYPYRKANVCPKPMQVETGDTPTFPVLVQHESDGTMLAEIPLQNTRLPFDQKKILDSPNGCLQPFKKREKRRQTEEGDAGEELVLILDPPHQLLKMTEQNLRPVTISLYSRTLGISMANETLQIRELLDASDREVKVNANDTSVTYIKITLPNPFPQFAKLLPETIQYMIYYQAPSIPLHRRSVPAVRQKTLSPSCPGFMDGSIVLSLESNASQVYTITRNSENGKLVKQFTVEKGDEIKIDHLSAGEYTLKKESTVPLLSFSIPSSVLPQIQMSIDGTIPAEDSDSIVTGLKLNIHASINATVYLHGLQFARSYGVSVRTATRSIDCNLLPFYHEYWDHYCTFVMNPNTRYTIAGSCRSGDDKLQQKRIPTSLMGATDVVVTTVYSNKMTVNCYVVEKEDDDIAVAFEIQGGVLPYVYHWSDSAVAKTIYSGERVYVSGLQEGRQTLTVLDSSAGVGNIVTCSLAVPAKGK